MGCSSSKNLGPAAAPPVDAVSDGVSSSLRVHIGSTSPNDYMSAQDVHTHSRSAAADHHRHHYHHPSTSHNSTDAVSPLPSSCSVHDASPHSLDLDSIDICDKKIDVLLESYVMLKDGKGSAHWTPRYIQLHSNSSVDIYGSKANCHEKRLLISTINLSRDLCNRIVITNTVIGIKTRPLTQIKEKLVEIQCSDQKKALALYGLIIAAVQD